MSSRIGIFGGGQLGAYLCQAASRLGLSSSVLAFTEDSMAKGFADRCIVAPPADVHALHALLATTDVLTFEVEAVPDAILDEISRFEAAGQIRVAPSVDVMRLLKDKLSQKQWLQEQGFATAEFVDCGEEVSLQALIDQFGLPFVQKAHQGGYDGKGVQVIRSAEQADELWRAGALAEKFIGDKREIAVLVARSADGDVCRYPVVEMLFEPEGNVLLQAHSPAAIPADIAEQALNLGQAIVARLAGVGLFAVEMFLTADGQLLVNEISPRVHNTGHLSMEANVTCQYEQHVRAVAGLPLGEEQQFKAAVMSNMLYSDGWAEMPKLACGANRWDQYTHVHWYGKTGGKQFRKMGHITSVGEDLNTAARRAEDTLQALTQPPGKVV